AFRTWGADAVGMSTVLEAVAARHAGLQVGAISCIANLAAGDHGAELTHEEVTTAVMASRETFASLLQAWIEEVSATHNF
ncbi:MAG: purine-nucleoside phosphorylase, partial [Myxococcota bacterium]